MNARILSWISLIMSLIVAGYIFFASSFYSTGEGMVTFMFPSEIIILSIVSFASLVINGISISQLRKHKEQSILPTITFIIYGLLLIFFMFITTFHFDGWVYAN